MFFALLLLLLVYLAYNATMSKPLTGQQLLRGLPMETQLELLAECFLDAREWRSEESDLLSVYREELQRQRQLVADLLRDLGTAPPRAESLPRPGRHKDIELVRNRYRKAVKV